MKEGRNLQVTFKLKYFNILGWFAWFNKVNDPQGESLILDFLNYTHLISLVVITCNSLLNINSNLKITNQPTTYFEPTQLQLGQKDDFHTSRLLYYFGQKRVTTNIILFFELQWHSKSFLDLKWLWCAENGLDLKHFVKQRFQTQGPQMVMTQLRNGISIPSVLYRAPGVSSNVV